MRKLAAITFVVVFATAAVLISKSTSGWARPPRDLAISFLGFTNDNRHGRVALLCVTNGGTAALYYSVDHFETRAPDGWTNLPAPIAARFGGSLEPRKSFVWPVPPPATNTVWRVRLSCTEQARGWVGMIHKGQDLYEGIITHAEHRRFGGRHYFVDGPEVTR